MDEARSSFRTIVLPMTARGVAVVTGVLLAAPMMTVQAAGAAHARAATGPCLSSVGGELDHIVVKRKPVRTRSGERVADMRVVAGHYSYESSGGASGTGEFWCVDLLPAEDFAHRSPRTRTTVIRGDLEQTVVGRGFEGCLYWGGSAPSLADDAIAVDVRIEGRRLRAHRVVRATFPELSPVD
jgi:hypothetical protein